MFQSKIRNVIDFLNYANMEYKLQKNILFHLSKANYYLSNATVTIIVNFGMMVYF